MDPDLTRLCAIPGNDDLTRPEAAHVLVLSEKSVDRLIMAGKLEAKRHEGRGEADKGRVRIPRAALVRYLVRRSTGDRAAILSAVKAQCPQYLPAVADLMPGAQAVSLPANVIPMPGARRARPHTDKFAGHPDLFGASA